MNNSKQQQRSIFKPSLAARLRAHYSMLLPSNAVAMRCHFFGFLDFHISVLQ